MPNPEASRRNGKLGGRPRKTTILGTPVPENPFKLSPDEQLFVEALAGAACFNKSKAYRLAFDKHDPSAACRLAQKRNVAAAIQQKVSEKAQKLSRAVMGGDEALERLSVYARQDIADVLPDGDPLKELPDHARLPIKSIKETRYGRNIEFHDPMRAAELLAKAAGRLKDAVDVSLTVRLEDLVAGEAGA